MSDDKTQRDDLEHQLKRLRATSSPNVQQNYNDDMPVERTYAAELLSGFCFENGIPTNSMQTETPREQLSKKIDGSWPPIDRDGNRIPNNYTNF